MVRVHIWLRKRDDLSEDEFRRHWIEDHAPIARDGYEYLTGYRIDLVTRVPSGQEAPYDGIAVLTWDDRDGMKADLASEAARQSTQDLASFTSGSGFLYVEEDVVK